MHIRADAERTRFVLGFYRLAFNSHTVDGDFYVSIHKSPTCASIFLIKSASSENK